ncbi:hypothetical protein HK102_006201 [Quaeritorhiza haematococci]|nr:hypothetical protein HK102_006201 [Quaeritorhiza haematococci]
MCYVKPVKPITAASSPHQQANVPVPATIEQYSRYAPAPTAPAQTQAQGPTPLPSPTEAPDLLFADERALSEFFNFEDTNTTNADTPVSPVSDTFVQDLLGLTTFPFLAAPEIATAIYDPSIMFPLSPTSPPSSATPSTFTNNNNSSDFDFVLDSGNKAESEELVGVAQAVRTIQPMSLFPSPPPPHQQVILVPIGRPTAVGGPSLPPPTVTPPPANKPPRSNNLKREAPTEPATTGSSLAHSDTTANPDCDPATLILQKRAKNTEAAKRSRQRKAQKMETLENRASLLQREHADLSIQVAILETEKRVWMSKEQEFLARIKRLEEQNAEAARAFMQVGVIQ